MFEGRNAKLVYTAIAIIWVVIVVRAAFNVKGPEGFVVTVAQSEVQAFARERLNAMQARSFAEKVELCAIVFETSTGELDATEVRVGDEATCDLRYFDEPGMAPLASIHTHGAFDENYDSEVPSLIDLEGDIESQIDGYVATPGGRLWRVNWQQQRAVLVCAEGCLRQDPAYRSCPGDPIAPAYSSPQLTARNRRPVVQC
ncbi:hypothetical protein FHS52_002124 [Erythromicrobium ramosum]|uniref:DUF4329 domain-containing protein n=1 Tax=Erythrobacter ramosus TaxID=35811 RepID=A0A6I4UI22_9SPHN|nr:DUF4329 domain-containing protein [Erythrobacter ramosus]MBB3776155.1 hypothetical protein [Erythrobacter ramosus]MXP38761.1 DUF4329 domain-containing protein [Erythrobacter ramosus]